MVVGKSGLLGGLAKVMISEAGYGGIGDAFGVEMKRETSDCDHHKYSRS